MKTTHTLEVAGSDPDLRRPGALPAADGTSPLLLVGQPMDASGFGTLAVPLPATGRS